MRYRVLAVSTKSSEANSKEKKKRVDQMEKWQREKEKEQSGIQPECLNYHWMDDNLKEKPSNQ